MNLVLVEEKKWVVLRYGVNQFSLYLDIFRAKIHFIIPQKQNTMWTGLAMLQDQPTMAPQTEKPNRKLPQHYFSQWECLFFPESKI